MSTIKEKTEENTKDTPFQKQKKTSKVPTTSSSSNQVADGSGNDGGTAETASAKAKAKSNAKATAKAKAATRGGGPSPKPKGQLDDDLALCSKVRNVVLRVQSKGAALIDCINHDETWKWGRNAENSGYFQELLEDLREKVRQGEVQCMLNEEPRALKRGVGAERLATLARRFLGLKELADRCEAEHAKLMRMHNAH